MTRQTKTPRQRAEEAAGIAQRRLHRLQVKRAAVRDDLADLEDEITEAARRLAYAEADPALAASTTDTEETPA